jgi:hypothetical protein
LSSKLIEIFEDQNIIKKIQKRSSLLFQIADLESSRAGKIGMEVGSIRERIVVALLIYKFGEANVETEIPITESEVDVLLFGKPVSIKTITGNRVSGVKISWTVDSQKAYEFSQNYSPRYDLFLVQINWGGIGGFYYIPLETQKRIFTEEGRNNYIKLPKRGTNPRGVEIEEKVMIKLIQDDNSRSIKINWTKTESNYNQFKRWVDLWREE